MVESIIIPEYEERIEELIEDEFNILSKKFNVIRESQKPLLLIDAKYKYKILEESNLDILYSLLFA